MREDRSRQMGETSYRFGAQVDDVLELDVVTGGGQLFSCSVEKDAELFNMVLAGLGQCGFVLRNARAAQPETAEPEDALEMGKQHLDPLSLATGLFEGFCAGQRTGNIAGIFEAKLRGSRGEGRWSTGRGCGGTVRWTRI